MFFLPVTDVVLTDEELKTRKLNEGGKKKLRGRFSDFPLQRHTSSRANLVVVEKVNSAISC